MKDTNELKWNKTYRYGCSTYAGTQYTADSLLHHYVIDVIGNKASGQEFILSVSSAVSETPIYEFKGKSITQMKSLADNYHKAVRIAAEKHGRQDVCSLLNLFKAKYDHIIHRKHPDTNERDPEKGAFIL